MPKPNYAFAKRQRELAKKKAKEEKRLRKLEARQPPAPPAPPQPAADEPSGD